MLVVDPQCSAACLWDVNRGVAAQQQPGRWRETAATDGKGLAEGGAAVSDFSVDGEGVGGWEGQDMAECSPGPGAETQGFEQSVLGPATIWTGCMSCCVGSCRV